MYFMRVDVRNTHSWPGIMLGSPMYRDILIRKTQVHSKCGGSATILISTVNQARCIQYAFENCFLRSGPGDNAHVWLGNLYV
jgi:hypothetical protein